MASLKGLASVKEGLGGGSKPSQRDKPRMSAAERRQSRKKKSGGEEEAKTGRTFATPMEKAEALADTTAMETPLLTTTPNPSGQEVMVALRKEIDVQVARQLSDSSNFVAQRCLRERVDENPNSVQRTLLAISRAHRIGLLSSRDKAILKDVLLQEGSKCATERISSMPGGSKVLSSLSSLSLSQGRTSHDPRLHVFRNQVEGYTVTMSVSEALRLEHCIIGCKEHCAVSSNFVCLQSQKIKSQLHLGTKQVLEEPNAGGKSFNSEALSFETLHALFAASELITELSVRYVRRHTSIVDYICSLFGHRVGVSVTRAMHFMGEQHFGYQEARGLIERKLSGLDRAGKYVVSDMRFHRQILHIWAQSERVGELCRSVFEELRGKSGVRKPQLNDGGSSDEDDVDENLPRPTVCLVTVCDRLERFVFANEGELDFEKGKRDPQGFEAMKRRLRKAEEDRISQMVIGDLRRKSLHQRAVQKVLSATKPMPPSKSASFLS